MADSWTYAAVPGVETVNNLSDAIEKVTDVINAAIEVSALYTQGAGALSLDATNTLDAAVSATSDALEETLRDLFQNNVHMAAHLNLNWDSSWTWRKKKGATNRNYEVDAQLPWVGTGMRGWLTEILVSAQDLSNPQRPLADTDSQTGGFIIVTGIAEDGDLSALRPLCRAFTALQPFDALLDENLLQDLSDIKASFTRLGPACVSPTVQEFLSIPANAETAYQEYMETVPTFAKGGSPLWLAPPLALLMPTLTEALRLADQAQASVSVSVNVGSNLSLLTATLRQRALVLADIVERLSSSIETLEDSITFLGNAYLIYLPAETGGFQNLIRRAMVAENLPAFGDRGIVAGVVLVATSDDPSNHLQALFDMIQVDLAAFSTDNSERWQKLQDTYDSYFP